METGHIAHATVDRTLQLHQSMRPHRGHKPRCINACGKRLLREALSAWCQLRLLSILFSVPMLPMRLRDFEWYLTRVNLWGKNSIGNSPADWSHQHNNVRSKKRHRTRKKRDEWIRTDWAFDMQVVWLQMYAYTW